jgi:hypothetical protein
MKTKNRCWWMLALPVIAVTACGEKPTEPEVAGPDPVGAFGRKVKPPPPSADIPLGVTIAGGPTGVLSDGLGDPEKLPCLYDYCDGDDYVSAVIRDSNGMLYFQTFAGKKRDEPVRGVTVDLGSMVGQALEPDDFAEFQAEVIAVETEEDENYDGWPVFTSDVTLHTRSLNGGLIDMGATLLDAGKIGFKDYGDASWEWRLLFGARVENEDGGVDHYEYGLCVTHLTETTWEVTTDGADCGAGFNGVAQLWRVVRGEFTHVADFNAPMQMTLETPPK